MRTQYLNFGAPVRNFGVTEFKSQCCLSHIHDLDDYTFFRSDLLRVMETRQAILVVGLNQRAVRREVRSLPREGWLSWALRPRLTQKLVGQTSLGEIYLIRRR